MEEQERFFCPICGTELKQGQYEFDYDLGDIYTAGCPECGDCGTRVLGEDEVIEKFGEEYAE